MVKSGIILFLSAAALAAVLLLSGGTGTAAASKSEGLPAGSGGPTARLVYFTVENCPDCERVGALLDSYRHEGTGDVEIVYYDLDDPRGLRLNAMLCRAFDVPAGKRRIAPAVFSARGALIHLDITVEALSALIADAAGLDSPAVLYGRDFADAAPLGRLRIPPPAAEPGRRRPAGGVALLTFFTKHHCADCRLAEKAIRNAAGGLRDELEIDVRTLFVDDPDGAEANLSYLGQLELGERIVAPSLFSSREALLVDAITVQAVKRLAQEAGGEPAPETVFAVDPGAGRRTLEMRFRELTAGAVAVGGLADGVFNPCAFTVVIFFIAYLTHIGKTRRQVFTAGVTFLGAVFFTYMALSAGLLRVLMAGAAVGMWLSYGLMLLTAVLVLIVSIASFRDALAIRRGGSARGFWVRLPDGLRSFLHGHISRRARRGLSIGGMLALGAVVAAVELPCTGMMLIPIVVLLSWAARTGGFGLAPYGWLLLYNLAFILPLMLVFAAVYFGVTSEQLTVWFRRHLFASKLVLGIVFLLLAALLFIIPVMGQERITDLAFTVK